jgi:hypothetical protein
VDAKKVVDYSVDSLNTKVVDQAVLAVNQHAVLLQKLAAQNQHAVHLQKLAAQNQHAVHLQKLAVLHQHAVHLQKLAVLHQHAVHLQKLAVLHQHAVLLQNLAVITDVVLVEAAAVAVVEKVFSAVLKDCSNTTNVDQLVVHLLDVELVEQIVVMLILAKSQN